MCAKFGCGLTVVSKIKGGDRQTDRQTDKGNPQLYIIESGAVGYNVIGVYR